MEKNKSEGKREEWRKGEKESRRRWKKSKGRE